jgi:glycine/D-amino acid oxidase-like deaminating enzyme
MLDNLIAQAKLQQQRFGDQVEILSKDQVHQQYMADQNAFGGIRYHDGFGLNPLKLAWGYQKLAREAGVKIHCATPLLDWREENGLQIVTTPKAVIKAQKVVIATNGYTPRKFHAMVDERALPVLSQIIVTQVLSDEQLAQCNFLTDNVVMDTRALKYFYRKLPDNRILFGGRGAITGKGAEDPYYSERLLKVLKTSFPALQNIQYDYAWSGWISVSLDDMPHIHENEQRSVFYAMGYCGSGVSFSVQAGKRLAQKVAGQAVPQLPIYTQSLKKFPLAPLRRVGQWGYFQYGKVKDKWL